MTTHLPEPDDTARSHSIRPVLFAVVSVLLVAGPAAAAGPDAIRPSEDPTGPWPGRPPVVEIGPGLHVHPPVDVPVPFGDPGTPLALAAADLDADGAPDVVAGYAVPGGGRLVLFRGRLAARYPHHPSARAADEALTALAGPVRAGVEQPLVPVARFVTPVAPAFLAAGDLDADGHTDVLAADRTRAALYLWRGDGRGGLAPAGSFALPGRVTALAAGEINRPDGLVDIAVATDGPSGPRLLVLQGPAGAWGAPPEVLDLPAPATGIAPGRLDADHWPDLAVAAGPELVVVHGRDRGAVSGDGSIAAAHRQGGRLAAVPPGSVTRTALPAGARDLAPDFYGAPVDIGRPPAAILPLRLNGDGLDDLVVLDALDGHLTVILSAAAATFTVRSTGDEGDAYPGDGSCSTSRATCTLRAAIDEANAHEGADAIHFRLPAGVQTLRPETALPVVFEALTIDGTTQPGYAGTPLIELDGSAIEPDEIGAGGEADGIALVNADSTVRGLAVNRFPGTGIVLAEARNATVEGNMVGTDPTGMLPRPNKGPGISIIRSADSTVGGASVAARNIIAGNGEHGVLVREVRSTGNRIAGNLIGLDSTGAPLGNGLDGVLLAGAPGNTVGGTGGGERNAIAANGGDGVELNGGGAAGNLVQGNLIGAGDADGPGNRGSGVLVSTAPETTIGGSAPGASNVIAGNDGDGVLVLGGDARGNLIGGNWIGFVAPDGPARGNAGHGVLVAEAPENLIGRSGEEGSSNLIVASGGDGVEVGGSGSRGNVVAGNRIGLGPADEPLGNGEHGVALNNAPDNRIGGADGDGNVIAANAGHGVAILGAGASRNRVWGNLIGVDPIGRAARGNAGEGVLVLGAAGNEIGGLPAEGARRGNQIAGNGGDGVRLAGAGADGNHVTANVIGADIERSSVLPNGGDGLAVVGGARRNVAHANTIGGNGGHGVSIVGAGTDGNAVVTNTIGSPALPNGAPDDPATGDGVHVRAGARQTRIAGNTILGNRRHGVHVHGSGTARTTVAANAVLSNTAGGVWIGGTAGPNAVGGPEPGEGNQVAANGGAGVTVASGTGNAVLSNAIFDNTGLAIDLGGDGVTPNGSGQAANRGQGFPLWPGAWGRADALGGTLAGRPGATYLVQVFASPTCDPSGHGEAAELRLSRPLTADGEGRVQLSLDLGLAPGELPAAGWVSATATDADGNTSELSPCLRLVVPQAHLPYGGR